MCIIQFVTGIISETSFNIRITATQQYLPETMRGRFNGTFQMLTMSGTLIGNLLCGAIGEIVPMKYIAIASAVYSLIAVFSSIYVGREDIAKIYNQDL